MSGARKSVTLNPDAPQLLGGTAIKPVERHGWEAVRYFVHNPETGAFFSRTPKSWFLITLFYLVYYSCLAGFWYGMLQVFFLSLNEDTPKWMKEESIIGVNPGMGVRPRQADPRIDSSMFRFAGDFKDTSDLEEVRLRKKASRLSRTSHLSTRPLFYSFLLGLGRRVRLADARLPPALRGPELRRRLRRGRAEPVSF